MSIPIIQMLLAVGSAQELDALLDTYSLGFGPTSGRKTYIAPQMYNVVDGDRKKWTLSCWIKREQFGTRQVIFSNGSNSSGEGFIGFNSDDTLYLGNDGHANFQSGAGRTYRDTSWMHLMWAADSTQANNDDRWKVYVNGELVPASEYNAPGLTQNGDGYIQYYSPSAGMLPCIGERLRHHYSGANWSAPFRGRMAQFYFVDGAQKTWSDFAVNENGVYKPIEYEGSVGTNGFYLPFDGKKHPTIDPLDQTGINDGTWWNMQYPNTCDGIAVDDTALSQMAQYAGVTASPNPATVHLAKPVVVKQHLRLNMYASVSSFSTFGWVRLNGSSSNQTVTVVSSTGTNSGIFDVDFTGTLTSIQWSGGSQANYGVAQIIVDGEVLKNPGWEAKYFGATVPVSKAEGGLPIFETTSGGRTAHAIVRKDYGPNTPEIIRNSGCVVFRKDADDALFFSHNADYSLGSETNWTIEFYFNKLSNTGDWSVLCGKGPGGNYEYFIETFDNGNLKFLWSADGVTSWTGSPDIATGLSLKTWYHLSVNRDGNSLKAYVNGVQTYSGSITGNIHVGNTGTHTLSMGGWQAGSNLFTHSLMSNFRLVKGSTVYTSAYDAPTEPLKNITNTKLLGMQTNAPKSHPNHYPMDMATIFSVQNSSHTVDAVGQPYPTASEVSAHLMAAVPMSSSLSDNYPEFSKEINWGSSYKTCSGNGNAQPSWTNMKMSKGFYGLSYYLDGNVDSVNVNDRYSNYAMGTGDYTVELRVMWYDTTSNVGGGQRVFLLGASGNSQVALHYENGEFKFDTTNGSNFSFGSYSPILLKWYHIAMVRYNGLVSLYVDGQQMPTTGTQTNNLSTANWIVGGLNWASGEYGIKGYVQDFRHYVGIAKYTGNFSAASEDPEVTADATYSTGSEKEAYPAFTSGSVMFDNNGDNIEAPDSADWNIGGGDFTIEAWYYPRSHGGWEGIIGQWKNNGWNATNSWLLEPVSGKLYFYYCRSDQQQYANVMGPDHEVPLHQWNHCCAQKKGNTIRVALNGIWGTATALAGPIRDASGPLLIGGDISGDGYVDGFVSNVRVTKGTAVYDQTTRATFDPPTEPLGLVNSPSNYPNDGKFWSSNGSYVIGHASHQLPKAFDGSTSANDYAMVANSNGDSEDLVVTLPGLPSGKTVRFFGYRNTDGGVVTFNGGAVSLPTGSGNQAWVTAANTTNGTTDSFTMETTTNNGSDEVAVFAVEVDGVVLEDGHTKLLCCQSTKFSRGTTVGTISGPTITNNGAAGDAETPSGGSGSVFFDGTNDWMDVAADTGFAMRQSEFTVECWIKNSTTGADGYYRRIFMMDGPTGNSADNPQISIYPGNPHGLNCWSTNGSLNLVGTINISDGQWHHIAMVRSNGIVTQYVDGVADGSQAYTTDVNLNGGSPRPRIGNYDGSSGGGDFQGYISNLRVVKGHALYQRNFTPPKPSDFVNDENIHSLWCCTSASSATESKDRTCFTVSNGSPENATGTPFNPFDNNYMGKAGKYATINPHFGAMSRSAYAGGVLSNGNLTLSTGGSTDNIEAAGIGSIPIPQHGKWYFETGPGKYGDDYQITLFDAAMSDIWEKGSGNFHYHRPTHRTFQNTDAGVVGYAINMEAGSGDHGYMIYKDGVHITSGSLNDDYDYLIRFYDYTSKFDLNVNFGQKPFKFAPPSGYKPLTWQNVQANIPIKKSIDHFGVKPYTGSGGTQTLTGMEFKPDMVWVKCRDHSKWHVLVDSVRGNDSSLWPATSNMANSEQHIPSFTADGFSVADIDSGTANESGMTYVGWCWRAGGAPTATNSASVGSVPTAGSVKIDGSDATAALAGTRYPNKMSVNTTAGFSIVHYTGTGNNFTLAHGLNKQPDVILVKTLDGATQDWMFYTKLYDGTNDWMALNTTANISDSGFAGADSTVFNYDVGASQYSNTNGRNYIQYNWHSVEGFSKFGKYLSSGSSGAESPYVILGFKPALVIIKSLNHENSETGWAMYTSALQGNPIEETILWANGNYQEGKRGDGGSGSVSQIRVDLMNDGFKIRNNGAETNEGNGTNWYLYMAWAEDPCFNSLGR